MDLKAQCWRFPNSAMYATASLVSLGGGHALRLTPPLNANTPLLYAIEFLAPFTFLTLTVFLFVAFSNLRFQIVAFVTGVAFHCTALRVFAMLIPITLFIFVGTAFIGAAIGRDVRNLIIKRRANQSHRLAYRIRYDDDSPVGKTRVWDSEGGLLAEGSFSDHQWLPSLTATGHTVSYEDFGMFRVDEASQPTVGGDGKPAHDP